MYSLKITSPTQVIYICFLQDLDRSHPEYHPKYGGDHALDLADVGHTFMCKFAQYLHGVGHPLHPQFGPSIIPLDQCI